MILGFRDRDTETPFHRRRVRRFEAVERAAGHALDGIAPLAA